MAFAPAASLAADHCQRLTEHGFADVALQPAAATERTALFVLPSIANAAFP